MPDQQELEDFIDAHEVARILKFTPQHIRRLAEDKIIPGKKYGREWRFRRSDLLRSHMEACAGGSRSQDVEPFSMPAEIQPTPAPKRPRGRPRN